MDIDKTGGTKSREHEKLGKKSPGKIVAKVIIDTSPKRIPDEERAGRMWDVSFRDAEENAVWIRIAWGTQYRKPNQYKPAYVVYYSQTPYAFTSSSQLKSSLPLLGQALTIASKHHQIVKMDLRSQYLDALKAIVFKQYNQTFETHNSTTPLQERSLGLDISMDSRIIHESKTEKERVQRVTQEIFGDYPQPRLEFAQYKLETKFKSDLNGGILAEREEPLRCLVKFSSPHLPEALKSLAPAVRRTWVQMAEISGARVATGMDKRQKRIISTKFAFSSQRTHLAERNLDVVRREKQQERKMQEADEPGTGVQIRREKGDQAVTAGWPRDSVPASWEHGDKP
eukprot:bmy_01664T0